MKTVIRLFCLCLAVFLCQANGHESIYPDDHNSVRQLNCFDQEIFVKYEYNIDKNGHPINLKLLDHNHSFFVRKAMIEIQATTFESGTYVVGEFYISTKTYPPITEKCNDGKTKSH